MARSFWPLPKADLSTVARRGHAHACVSSCEVCSHFLDDPAALEAQLPGIGALSSMYGSVRGRAGICAIDDVFRDPVIHCGEFRRRFEGRR